MQRRHKERADTARAQWPALAMARGQARTMEILASPLPASPSRSRRCAKPSLRLSPPPTVRTSRRRRKMWCCAKKLCGAGPKAWPHMWTLLLLLSTPRRPSRFRTAGPSCPRPPCLSKSSSQPLFPPRLSLLASSTRLARDAPCYLAPCTPHLAPCTPHLSSRAHPSHPRQHTHMRGREEEGEEAKDAGQGSGRRKAEQAAQAGGNDRPVVAGPAGDLDDAQARFLDHVLHLAAPSPLPCCPRPATLARGVGNLNSGLRRSDARLLYARAANAVARRRCGRRGGARRGGELDQEQQHEEQRPRHACRRRRH